MRLNNQTRTLAEVIENALGETQLLTSVVIGAVCILEVNNRFFLLVELESMEEEQVVVIRISATQAQRLLNMGVDRCEVRTTIPQPTPGTEVNFICVLVVEGQAFLVFDVEDDTDELVLVSVDLCRVIGRV